MAQREIILDISARTGDIQKRIREIDRALVDNRETLKQLNADYKSGAISSKQYADATGNVKRESSDLRKEQRSLVKQIDQVNKATNAAEGSNEQLRAQLGLLTTQYNKLSKEQRENTKEGRRLQKQTKALSKELKKNESAVGDNRRNVGNYTQSIKNAGAALLGPAGLIFGVSSLFEVFGKTISVFRDFDQALATLQAISGATSEEMRRLEADAQRLGSTTQFTAEQVVELQTNCARVGFDTSQIVAATEATLNLAIATGEDLATSAEVTAFTLGGYGLAAEETARVTDVMAASFNASALNLERFQEATKLVSPIAKTANVDIEATTAALGALADAGLTGSVAGTGLRNVIFELGNENSKLAKKVGFAVTDSESFIEALKVLKEQGIGTTEALELIDRRGVPALLNLVENSDKVEELSNQFRNADGAAASAAETVGNTFSGDLLRAQSALEGVAIQIGQFLEPALRGIVQGFTTFINRLSEASKFAVQFTNGLIDLYNNSLFIRVGIQGIITSFRNLFDIGTTLFDQLTEGFSTVGKAISSVLKGDFSNITTIFEDFSRNSVERFKKLGGDIGTNISEGVNAALNSRIEPIVSTVLNEASENAGKEAGKTAGQEFSNSFEQNAKAKTPGGRGSDAPGIGAASFNQEELEALRNRLNEYNEIVAESGQEQNDILNRQNERFSESLEMSEEASLKSTERIQKAKLAVTKETETKRFQIITGIGDAFAIAEGFAREDSIAAKALGIGKATVNTYVAANQALATPAPPPIPGILAALTIAQGLLNVSKIAGVQFATGGRVSNSMQNIPRQSNGDNVLATVRTGEAVLTPSQQMALGGPRAMARAGVPGFNTGGLVGASPSLDGGAFVSQRSSQTESQAAAVQLQETIKNIPPPVVSVKEFTRVQTRVDVKEQTRSL